MKTNNTFYIFFGNKFTCLSAQFVKVLSNKIASFAIERTVGYLIIFSVYQTHTKYLNN
jgi:hypothetical protein